MNLMQQVAKRPGIALMLTGGAIFFLGTFVAPLKSFERLAVLAALIGAGAEGVRMALT